MLWRLLRPYLSPRSGPIVLIVVMLVAQSLGNLYLPNLNADLINRGIVEGNLGYIWATGAEMLAVTLAISAVAIIGVYWASRVSMSVGADLRRDVFGAVQTFSLRDMSDFGTPSLITRNTNDVQQIQMVLQISLTMMVVAPIMMIGGMIFAIREGARLLPVLAVAVPLMVVFLAIMMSRVVPRFRVMQVKIDRITQVLREQITGVRVVRAFVRGPDEARRFDEANADLTATTLSVNRLFALMMPTMMAILNLTSVAVMWFGGRLAAEGSVSIGNLTAVLSYILQILIAVMMATMLAIMVPRAMASAERIAQVLAATPSIVDPPAARRPAHVDGAVELAGVHFRYPGSERAVLEDVTVHVAPGQISAVIGGTGSGKSTLLNLVARFLDVSAGTVRVHGLDVREQSREQLWSTIGLVPQAAYLFGGTVASNLRLGAEEAGDEDLWRALAVAQASDFVSEMGGLSSPIDQGGTNVSGGQRQRLAIARALVRRPALYLFDDCFSALDAETDARLRAALPAYTGSASVLVVAQRVSTIMGADQIIVLDEGRVAGVGAHDDLMSACDPYREIVLSQLGPVA